MGQKVNPRGFRLGVYLDWNARWFSKGGIQEYGKSVLEDIKIRKFVDASFDRADIAKIEIEKSGDNVRVIIHSAKPGVIIGKKGQEIDAMRKKLSEVLHKQNIEISVQEVKKPEVDAMLVAKSIADQLEKRASYKKVMKRGAISAIKAGAKGAKIRVKGRLNGAEIARTEWTRLGSAPLHTLRSDIDFGFAEAHTTYGIIGVSVWICKGEYQHA